MKNIAPITAGYSIAPAPAEEPAGEPAEGEEAAPAVEVPAEPAPDAQAALSSRCIRDPASAEVPEPRLVRRLRTRQAEQWPALQDADGSG